MKSRHFLLPVLISSVSLSSLQAGTPLGGLTVAVSADGSQLVAGGDTRTLLILDPKTLETKERHWIGTSILNIAFNKDGSVLAVQDTSDAVYLYKTSDWTEIAKIPKVVNFSAASDADLIAGHDGDYKKPNVKVFSFTDGSEKGSIPLPEGKKVAALGINSEGTKIAILCQGEKDEAEPKVERSAIPKDLKGIASKEFQQKNDGKTSTFLLIDIASSSIETEAKTFFTESKGSIAYSGENIAFVEYGNVNAKITPSGEFTLFELANSYNYGIGFNHDCSKILTGGLAKFSITPMDSLEAVTGKLDKLPGWPEYFKGFTGTADGSALYGSTSAYRVVKFLPDGSVAVAMPGN